MLTALQITEKAKEALDTLHIRYTDQAYGDAWRIYTIHTKAPFTINGIEFVMVDGVLQLATEHGTSPEYLIIRSDTKRGLKYSVVPADQVVGTFHEIEAAQALLDLLQANKNTVTTAADIEWMNRKLNLHEKQ
jgi:hypothetical protein